MTPHGKSGRFIQSPAMKAWKRKRARTNAKLRREIEAMRAEQTKLAKRKGYTTTYSGEQPALPF